MSKIKTLTLTATVEVETGKFKTLITQDGGTFGYDEVIEILNLVVKDAVKDKADLLAKAVKGN
jgi:hypothetical protein